MTNPAGELTRPKKPNTASTQPAKLAAKISVIASLRAPCARLAIKISGNGRRREQLPGERTVRQWVRSACTYFRRRPFFNSSNISRTPTKWLLKISFATSSSSKKRRVGNRIEDARPGLPAGHDISNAQDCQLLRNVRRFNLEDLAQFAYALLAPSKAIHDPNADRVCERLKELRFEVGKLVWHSNIQLFKYIRLRGWCRQRLKSFG